MHNKFVIIVLLRLVATIGASICPEGVTYQADASSGCQVYHVCEDAKFLTFSCASGQAFSEETLSCEPVSAVSCYGTADRYDHLHKQKIEEEFNEAYRQIRPALEDLAAEILSSLYDEVPVSASHVHRLHKREIEEVHTFDVNMSKEKLTEAYRKIQPVLENLVVYLAPSIYGKFSSTYLPAIRKLQNEVFPFFYAKVYPRVQKYLKTGLDVAKRFIEKAYMSYQLSNSTHIAIVSVSDIAKDIYDEIQPLLAMGKDFSSSMMKNKCFRGKRESSENKLASEKHAKIHVIDIHELNEKVKEAYKSIRPLVESLVAKVAPSIHEEFTSTYLPNLLEMKKEISSFFNTKAYSEIRKYFRIARNMAGKLIENAYSSYKLSNSTHISIVSWSGIADEVYDEIKPLLDLGKFLSATMKKSMRYRGKREAPKMRDLHKENEVHMIDIHQTKEKLVTAYLEIRPILQDLIADIAPSVYEKFVFTYLPAIRKLQNEALPFFYAKIYPKVQKYVMFGLDTVKRGVEKAYASYKLSNSTHIAIVSVSDIAKDVYNEIQPLLNMGKYYSTSMMNNRNFRGKRETSENELVGGKQGKVHLIEIQELKDKVIETYRSIRPLVEKLAVEVAPSIYDEITHTYLPKLREMKNKVTSFLNPKLLSNIQKYARIARNVAGKLVENAYMSYELSNSTHIAVVSFSGITNEVYNDIKPLLNLGKFLSGTMRDDMHNRGKREAPEMQETNLVRKKRQLPDLMFTMLSPFAETLFNSMTSTLFGGSDTLVSNVILPLVYDVMGNEESKYDGMSLILVSKSIFTPLLWEMMKRQTFHTPEGTIIRIPKHLYVSAITKFKTEARPIIKKLLNRHLRSFLQNLALSSSNVIQFIDNILFEKYEGADILKDQVLNFFNKHRNMFKTSTSTYVNFYPLTEIMKDLKPIKASVMNVVVQYLKRSPNSLLNKMFGEGSLLQKTILGDPVYAKPQNPTYARPRKFSRG